MELAAFIIFFTVLLYELLKSLLDSFISVKNLNKKTTSAPTKKQGQPRQQPQKKVIVNNTYNIIITDYEKLKDKRYIDIK